MSCGGNQGRRSTRSSGDIPLDGKIRSGIAPDGKN
jgi:hypothetical protein